MPLTVLSDENVQDVLNSLTKQDVLDMHKKLADALHSYSTATDTADSGCCQSNQPHRLQIKLKNGATTLFMPSISDNGLGIKVVTLSEGSDKRGKIVNLPTKDSRPGTPTSPSSPSLRRSLSPASSSARSSSQSLRHSSTGGSSSLSSSTTPAHRSSVSTTSTTTSATDVSAHTLPEIKAEKPAPEDSATTTSPCGTLTLLSENGQPRAIVSARTLTAFRTALASCLLLKARRHCHTMTVFGAGKQAYWHIHVALLLRGSEIHHLHLINRSFDRAAKVYKMLGTQHNQDIQNIFLEGKIKPEILTPEFREYDRLSKEAVRASDVIMCCTPSTTPLFPASYLTSTEARRKARYIAAVGSYKPHMQELPVELLHQAVRGPEERHHGLHHRTAGEGGAVVVDTIEGAMTEAGEIIKSGIGGQGVVELGELVMLKRSHWAEKAEKEELERDRREREGQKKESSGGHGLSHLFSHKRDDSQDSRGSSDKTQERKRSKSRGKRDDGVQISDGGLQEWLQRGNVVYKSVGIGLMDVVVGMAVVELAEQRGIGTTFASFT